MGFEETDSDLQYLTSLLQENQPYNLLPLSQLQTSTRKHKTQWWKDNNTTSHGTHSPPTSIIVLPNAGIFSIPLASTSSSTHKARTQEIPLLTLTTQHSPIEIYTAYSQKDEDYYLDIKEQLDILRRQGWSISCHASEITHSTTWKNADNLDTANLILLLVSATFLNSDFCYCEQLHQAIKQRSTDKRCCFLPIILRPVSGGLLKETPFGSLDFLPTNRKAISAWTNPDAAYENVTNYILDKLGEIKPYL